VLPAHADTRLAHRLPAYVSLLQPSQQDLPLDGRSNHKLEVCSGGWGVVQQRAQAVPTRGWCGVCEEQRHCNARAYAGD
jgi:hypothetical protein